MFHFAFRPKVPRLMTMLRSKYTFYTTMMERLSLVAGGERQIYACSYKGR